jgi:hypothetical protein
MRLKGFVLPNQSLPAPKSRQGGFDGLSKAMLSSTLHLGQHAKKTCLDPRRSIKMTEHHADGNNFLKLFYPRAYLPR